MKKTLLFYSKLFIILTSINTTSVNSNDFMTGDGDLVTHVKHCLFHGNIYETYLSIRESCTFNVLNPHPGDPHYDLAGRNVPHDPDCFGERNTPLF